MREKTPNCTSEDAGARLGALLAQLTTDQIRFVVARQECSTDTDAAKAVGLSRSTVAHWPDVVQDAVRLMALDGAATASHVRRRNLAKAMLVKVRGLDSVDERIRQSVATEIIEWEMGKATQRQELTGADGGAIVVVKRLGNVSSDDL